jgi:hypothetical protein
MAVLSQMLRNQLSSALTSEGAANELRAFLGRVDPAIGSLWFVDSGAGSDNNSGTTQVAAFATIDKAINSATASNGDIIYVMAGHAETVSNATTIVPDVAGLTFVGLGRGADRPTITFDNAAGNIPVSGASCAFSNFLFLTSGSIDVTAGITVTGADCVLLDIEMREASITSQIVDGIVLAAGGDRCTIENLVFLGQTASDQASASAISVTGALSMVHILNPWIVGSHSAGCIENVSGVCTDLRIEGAIIEQRHTSMDAGITVVATSSGHIISPRIRTATDDNAGFDAAITATNDMQLFDVQIVNADGQVAGITWGTASAGA